MDPHGADHHRENKEVGQDEGTGHDTSDDIDGAVGEGVADGEGGGDEGGVGKDEAVPGHGESHARTGEGGVVGEDGDEEEIKR